LTKDGDFLDKRILLAVLSHGETPAELQCNSGRASLHFRLKQNSLTGPTERDIFFASRADLVVLFWDGKSKGTARVIDFFQRNMNNVLIGFV
jgi:hypothetical protein